MAPLQMVGQLIVPLACGGGGLWNVINDLVIASSKTWWGSMGKKSVKHNLLHRDAVSACSYINHSHQNTVPMMTTVPVLTMATKTLCH